MSFVIQQAVAAAARSEFRKVRGRLAGRIAMELQARIPVLTGRAQASIDGGASLPDPPPPGNGPFRPEDPSEIERRVAGVDPAITAEVGIAVPYANVLRLGHSPKAEPGWVDDALRAAGVGPGEAGGSYE